MKYFNVDAEKLYQCTGCGTVTKDPGKHQELIQKAGELACCPDNSYIECMPPLQPPIMFARKHDIETFERSIMRPDNCGLLVTVQNVADQHYQAPLFAEPQVETFQNRVQPWMMECFGAEVAGDLLERGDRKLEEDLELLQSVDYPKERIQALVEYVYSRPKGDPQQEVGGVMVTLAAFCLAHGLDMHQCGETELARIWTKVPQIRAKQAAKAAQIPFSPLPIAPDENLVTVDKRDLFDLVRGAIKDAMETDEGFYVVCKMSQAELWSVANDRTVKVIEKLFPANNVEQKAAA